MNSKDKKYADLLISVGVNVQEGQSLLINAEPVHHDFVKLLVETAYQKGAKEVIVEWGSQDISRLHYLHQSSETLTYVPKWLVDKFDDLIERDLCLLALRSPNPHALDGVDMTKVRSSNVARSKALENYRNYTMKNRGQWLVCAYPTLEWAAIVFPDLPLEEAYQKLYDYVLFASKIDEGDAIRNWQKHNEQLKLQNQKLNEHKFKALRFNNAKGTDITVGLVADHIWSGGVDTTTKGRTFNPNIPSEETFTTPDRNHVDGIVYNTLPLNSNGRLVDDFWLKFVDGEVVDFDAKTGKDVLENLLATDENSKRIGEIALIANSTPIAKLNTLFYNTLFDENASCHMALGDAYPLIPDGESYTKDELINLGLNQSMIHVDFMFGSKDMRVVGIKQDGTEVLVMDEGEFVL